MRFEVDASSKTEPIIVMRRTLDAPRAVVWTAMTEPRHVARWFGGHGFENPVCEMDVRPGGRWRHVMRTPDGQEYPSEYEFLEVQSPERLVWRTVLPPGGLGAGPHDNVMTITLEEVGKQTRWTLVARFKSFEDRAQALQIQFTHVLEQGVERMDTVARELASR